MKTKTLVAFDGLNYSPSLTRFAIDFARDTKSPLLGVFINDLRYLDYLDSYGYPDYVVSKHSASSLVADDDKKINEFIKLFEGECKRAGVPFRIHLDKGVPLQELLNESVFADLILIDVKTSFFAFSDQMPSTFLKDLLVESKCPVLIVPEDAEKIKHILFSYDGSDSSVYAMKMFSYLFPEWKEYDAVIVSVNKNSVGWLPKGCDIKDWLRQHFDKVDFEVLSDGSDDSLIEFLKKNKKQSLVIMGAYGRSAWSRMFHASISNKVMNEVKMPLFVAHQ